MKILSVADLHYTLKQWDWLKGVAGEFDLLVIPGDLLDIVSPVALDVQILVVRKYLQRLPELTQVLVSSGNHDGDRQLEGGEWVADWLREVSGDALVGDGGSWERDGVLFTVCPWWDGEGAREEVGKLLEVDGSKDRGKWVWLYHAPPAGSRLAWDGRRDFGDEALRGWIERYRPDVVLSGHIHQAPFVKGGGWYDRIGTTMVFNAGKQIGPVPAFIELDLGEDRATWRSLAGEECVRLSTGQRLEA
jgi:Icc-related predicted phosphoesterase